MNYKRVIELSFLGLFALGVGIALLIHQSYDQWLTQLVQASGRKVGGGALEVEDLKWLVAEQKLSLSSAQWFDGETAGEAWFSVAASQWQLPANAWQGALFHTERFAVNGVTLRVKQEGLSTNINRLIKRVEAVVIEAEKQRKGTEALLFKLDSVALLNVQVELTTLKHGVLRWNIPELILPRHSNEPGLAFDVLLQQITLQLLYELKLQTTQHLLSLTEPVEPAIPVPSNSQ
ncbi:MAG TPA: hypothetical protein VIZ65_10300 [Cellvibrionaceae bacterium]